MRKGILLLFAGFLLCLSAEAQNSDIPEKISLQEAINIALENNYQLKQASNDLGLMERGIRNEYADFLPSISGDISGGSSKGQQLVREGNTQIFVDNVTNSLQGSVGANVTLFNGFENILSLRISKADKISTEESLQWTKESVIFNTASNFLQVLLDEELLEIARENLASSRKQLEQVKAQVEVGSRPTVDLYNQESTVASNELTVTQRENNLKLSRLQLIRQLQVDPQGDYEFVTPNFDTDSVAVSRLMTGTDFSVDKLIQQALDSRSDLKSDKANLETLEMQLKQAKYNLLPTLSANANLSSSYSDQYFGGGVSFSEQLDAKSITNTTFQLKPIGEGQLKGFYSYTFNVVNFCPEKPLQPNTTYEIVVPKNGLIDMSGNATKGEFSSLFSTGTELSGPTTFINEYAIHPATETHFPDILKRLINGRKQTSNMNAISIAK